MNVAIIPARGGSKRIARKNIREFAGRPMIAWSIAAAQESALFDQVIVSTDDEQIADIARELGASVPFMRPADLADDYTGTMPVLKHALQWLAENMSDVQYACCIYATAPFVQAQFLRAGYQRITSGDCDYAFAVTSFEFAIQRAVMLTDSGKVQMFQPEYEQSRSQDLMPAYHDAGQFYWGTTQAFIAQRPVFSSDSAGILIPRHLVQDIDTDEDWRRAELMFQALRDQHPQAAPPSGNLP